MRKNILLINPPLYFSKGSSYSLDSSVPPLGILYLASYINKYSSNFNASVIDVAAQNLCLKEVSEKVDEVIPFAVGISAMTPQLQGCVELASYLKKTSKVKPYIFLGGPHISADPD
ncbi:MAG: cobalamin-dependent protein, partial [Candidatus Omnitrophica bacterium]|nr:cobalamin-dependent protein [Candidatus Omnitrophota bacterium]